MDQHGESAAELMAMPLDQIASLPRFPVLTIDMAVELKAARDADARKLSHMSAPKLREVIAAEFASQGRTSLTGFARHSRDELVGEILEIRYPHERLNEAIHVMYHQQGGSSACEWCHPHDGGRCDCSRKVGLADHPAAPSETCPRCSAINWGQTPDGGAEG